MTAVFEFFLKYPPHLFEKGTVALRPWSPWYLTCVLAAGAMIGAYLLYRRTAPTLSGAWRAVLVALRVLSLLVILLIFLRPVLVLRSAIPQQCFVALAYDVSKSMEIRDGPEGKSRLEVQQDLLRSAANPLLEALGKRFKLRYFRFAGQAERTAGVEDPGHHGNVTDLSRTLDQIAGELEGSPLAGIVLVTDGADNHSANLQAAAAELQTRGIPVYPIGIGKAALARDTEILKVTTPRRVLKGAVVEADIAVRCTGYAGRRAKLIVREGDKVLQSQEVTLGGDGEVKTHKLSFGSPSAGTRIFVCRLEPFAEEIVSENNDQDAVVLVEDEQPQILYMEGEPRWIYGFLRRTTLEDKNLRLVTLLRQAQGKYLRQGVESPDSLEKGFPTDRAELFRYKAVILGSVEASALTFDQLRLISDFVSVRGGGFLMLGGKSSFGQGGYANTPLEDLLPVALYHSRGGAAAPDFQDIEFRFELTDYGLEHPVTRLSLLEAENRKRWQSVPPIVGFNPTAGAKPGATVLARGLLFNDGGQKPVLLAFQRFGRGKSMALASASIWLWRMELDHRDNTHDVFWRQVLRWLVSDAPSPVNVDTEKPSYSLDESVAIRAEVHDETFARQNNARVLAQVKAPSGQVTALELVWDAKSEGQYSTLFRPKEEGIHGLSIEALRGDKNLGSAKAAFQVADSRDEYRNAALNAELLKRLAHDTGGRYYAPSDVRRLAEDISYVDKGPTRIEERDLWDMPLLYLLFLGMISAEWMLRKRKGLA